MRTWFCERPAAIRQAVLVDRCVAALPMRADAVGMRLQVARADIVQCQVPPCETAFNAQLLQPEPQGPTHEEELSHVQRP